jgi:hypothetical protein
LSSQSRKQNGIEIIGETEHGLEDVLHCRRKGPHIRPIHAILAFRAYFATFAFALLIASWSFSEVNGFAM